MKTVAVIGYEGVEAFDLLGPLEIFARARTGPGEPAPYRAVILGLNDQPFVTESGIVFNPQGLLDEPLEIDTLIVPGGLGVRVPETTAAIAAWLAANGGSIRRIASVCTGLYALAASGLIDGRRVTTHWNFAADVARRFPALKVDADAIYINDGRFWTSAGIMAGVDLSLAMVEADLGPSVAMAIARDLVVYLRRPGGQEQFSEPLRFQTRAPDRFADLIGWMRSHLTANLDVTALADRVALSPRQFTRRFKAVFEVTPGDYVERLRLDEARVLLTDGRATIETIAAAVGFQSPDTFRRAFERRFGINPSAYRTTFRVAADAA